MKRAGFTMIELIFVIVILGILAAVALPKFAGVSDQARVGKLQGYVGTLNRTVLPAYWSESLLAGTQGSIKSYGAKIDRDLEAPDGMGTDYAKIEASTFEFKDGVTVELASHTDSRGTKESNVDLSERRAQAVVNYLMTKGVHASQLVAKGYGETRLTNRCSDGVTCTEREHLANRRTEFRIINQ